MKLHATGFVAWLATFVLAGPVGFGEPAMSSPEEAVRPSAAGWMPVGSVDVNAELRMLRMTGWVNMTRGGPVEYLICGPRGKTHETVFVVEGSVTDLHAAFLLLGVRPGAGPEDVGRGRPSGPECIIRVEWDEEGTVRKERAESFVWNLAEKAPLPDTGWVFTGSILRDGRYMATLDESFVATYWDPWAVINIPLEVGADDTLLAIHEEVIPPEGTPVRITFEMMPYPSPPPGGSDAEPPEST